MSPKGAACHDETLLTGAYGGLRGVGPLDRCTVRSSFPLCRSMGKNAPSAAGPTRRTVLVTALAAAAGVATARLLGLRDLGRIAGTADVAAMDPDAMGDEMGMGAPTMDPTD